MENMNNWDKVETALAKLEQLNELMQVCASNHLDMPTDSFVQMAETIHNSMATLSSLEIDVLLDAQRLLKEAIDMAYQQKYAARDSAGRNADCKSVSA